MVGWHLGAIIGYQIPRDSVSKIKEFKENGRRGSFWELAVLSPSAPRLRSPPCSAGVNFPQEGTCCPGQHVDLAGSQGEIGELQAKRGYSEAPR